MRTAKDPVLSAIVLERQKLERRIKVLSALESQLRAAGPAPAPTPGVNGQRAPKGALREAIIDAMKGAGEIMSSRLKRKLRESGYDNHINGQYFTKTLRSLVEEGAVAKKSNGAYSTYRLNGKV